MLRPLPVQMCAKSCVPQAGPDRNLSVMNANTNYPDPLCGLDLFDRTNPLALSAADYRWAEVEGFARAVRALARDAATRDAQGTPGQLHRHNGRVLRAADALAAATRRLAEARLGLAADLWWLAFAGLDGSELAGFLALPESLEGWDALANVESTLRAAAASDALLRQVGLGCRP
jgi:hypothetical protein